jgi:hypothetical protein
MIDVRGSYQNLRERYPDGLWDSLHERNVVGLSVVSLDKRLVDIIEVPPTSETDEVSWIAGWFPLVDPPVRRFHLRQSRDDVFVLVREVPQLEIVSTSLERVTSKDKLPPQAVDSRLRELLVGGTVIASMMHASVVCPDGERPMAWYHDRVSQLSQTSNVGGTIELHDLLQNQSKPS